MIKFKIVNKFYNQKLLITLGFINIFTRLSKKSSYMLIYNRLIPIPPTKNKINKTVKIFLFKKGFGFKKDCPVRYCYNWSNKTEFNINGTQM